jgi:membrane protein implicated in regulation of membrane protease activity
MKLLRWLAAGIVSILAAVLGLVGVVLCPTIILLPLGVLLLMLAERLLSLAAALALPRAVRHPVQEAAKAARRPGRRNNRPRGGLS